VSANILVVDDEESITDLVEVYLKSENYNVYKFYTGKEALECIVIFTLQ
jgi:two-component system response regulator VanR